MLSSSNALFVFEAAARSGSFTRAADELNVTQPAVSRMLSRFESYLGVRLFDRAGRSAALTPEGETLYRRVSEGFRSIETGLHEVEQLRAGSEIVTLSVSSAFTTQWLMPRMDRFRRAFPQVDLRFQLIAGSVRGPVENVDLGMRFVERDAVVPPDAVVACEVMLPVCSPSYLADASGDGNTLIQLTDSPTDWATQCAPFSTGREGPPKTLTYSDYALVLQAALLGQGIAYGWTTVVSHGLNTGTLVPVAPRITAGPRISVLMTPQNRPPRPVVRRIRDWIKGEMRAELEAFDRANPDLGVAGASYGRMPA